MEHYEKVHVPLVRATPKLQSIDVHRVAKTVYGGEGIFLIARMTFADRASFDQAMASAENKAAGKDLMSFAAGAVTLLVTDDTSDT
ncbi:uncharacterized protein (TIGR02118 family) [Sphingobium sp. AEW010]|nr:uncharacterized protein (TIGR02118 family) [Sphingobium sp. AEW010]TWD18408.1 uncharacterized protein (TIGR02118 family) [Sphingobium sp. AEW013]TWD21036.1 uncharacterized protein (TIGR02118 family) [Sphingobium sp. AEW001]